MLTGSSEVKTVGRIVFLLPSLLGGGAEFVTRTWAEELVRQGYRAEIALLRYSQEEPELSVPVHRLAQAKSGRRAEIRALRAFYQTLDSNDWLVAMMTRANNQALLLKRKGGAKVAVSERNIPRTEPGQSQLHVATRDLLMRRLYPRADRLIAISHPVASLFHFGARVDQSRIWVVPNPALGKTGLTGDVSISPRSADMIDIVVPARVVDAKRPELALAVAEELHARGLTVQLRYFGDGDLRARYQSLRRDFTIEANGRVERWFEHLNANSVVLLPSIVEGFGNVLLEAAASGVPSVVGSNTYGAADALIPGVTGFFARGERVNEYADAIEEATRIEATVPEGWLRTFSVANSVSTLIRALSGHPSDTRTTASVG